MRCSRHAGSMPLAETDMAPEPARGRRRLRRILRRAVPVRGLIGGLVPVLAAVGLALASYGWLQRIAALDAQDAGALARLPDYWMEGVNRTLLSDSGEVEAVLDAVRMVHFPDDNSTELEQPRLALYNATNKTPWLVESETGWVSGDGEVVRLNGAVEIFRLDEAGVRRYEVLTANVKLLPRERYAETDEPALITGPSTQTHAVGLRANLSRNRLQLLDRVRTVYEPSGYQPPEDSR